MHFILKELTKETGDAQWEIIENKENEQETFIEKISKLKKIKYLKNKFNINKVEITPNYSENNNHSSSDIK